MTKKHSTKRALIMSALSLLLCLSMLVGTTFAWFTDSVASANNVIMSGNLDIDLEYWNGTAWTNVNGSSEILDQDALWEPGYTEVVYLKLTNAGSLALKYQLGINIISEKLGVNKAGEEFKLSDYIKFGVVEGVNGETDAYADRDAAVAGLTGAKKISAGYTKADSLLADSAPLYLAMVVYMPTTVGNEANHDGVNVPEINLGINVFATQYTYEEDSFGNDYDLGAGAFTVAEANAAMLEGKSVVLYDCYDEDGVLYIPAGYTGTLTLSNVSISSIQPLDKDAETTANIVVLENVSVVAATENTSAITATYINIDGDGVLTAVANGSHAYGIGGDATKSIVIKNVTIEEARGGYVQPEFINDTKYGKSEPEGGAAIGSGYNGAEITLKGVVAENIYGGSKAAGIGARYWTGVSINIVDCEIINVYGGNASAAIGASRVSSDCSEAATVINITGTYIENAQGGQFGSGIGSGYDTHCASEQPLCTINVSDSVIYAQGGQYGAGIGTGFHTAALAGEIKDSDITAVSGAKYYKNTYTAAMDIGFGVVDPAREGTQTDSYIIVDGKKIGMADAPDAVADSTELASAIADGATVYLHSGAYTLPSMASYKNVTVIASDDATVNPVNSFNFGADNTYVNLSITGTDAVKFGYVNGDVTFEDCSFIGKQYAFHIDGANGYDVTFNNCTFKNRVALAASGSYEFNECDFLYQYSNYNTINIYNEATFNDCYWASKLELAIDDGAKAIIDGDEFTSRVIFISDASALEAFAREVNSRGNTYAGKVVMLSADIDMTKAYYATWTPVGQTGATQFMGTFDGHGYTIKNLNINTTKQTGANYATGFFGWLNNAVVRNVNFENATVVGNHYVGVVAGYMETAGCTIENCHVIGATVTATHVNDDVCGDKVGVIVGYAGNSGVIVKDCTATDATVSAGRDAGQIAGAAKSANVIGCSAENVSVTADGTCTGANVNEAIIGRVTG